LGLLLILAGLDAGAAVKTTVVAMEQVATWVAELLSVRVLPFYLAMSALAWVGIPPTVKAGGSAKASACQTCASSAAGAMCGAEGRGGCGSSKAGADASASSSRAKTRQYSTIIDSNDSAHARDSAANATCSQASDDHGPISPSRLNSDSTRSHKTEGLTERL
jgi:hypothetical protein